MENEQKMEIRLLKKYKALLVKLGIVILIFIVAIVAIFFKGYSNASERYEIVVDDLKQQVADLEQKLDEAPIIWDDKPATEITIDFIKAEIKNIGELATIEYLYTDAGKFEDPKKVFGVNIPFTTKSFIAKWDGIIKAGINIDNIIVEINDVNKEIIVHMPGAEILSHEIDSSSVETLDEKDGLFNPVKVEDVRLFDAVSKESMELRAVENGVLNKAYDNAKEIILRLVNNDVIQEQGYIVKFEMID